MENLIQLQLQLHHFCIINYNYNYVIGPGSVIIMMLYNLAVVLKNKIKHL